MHSNVNQLTNINRSKFIQIVWKWKKFQTFPRKKRLRDCCRSRNKNLGHLLFTGGGGGAGGVSQAIMLFFIVWCESLVEILQWKYGRHSKTEGRSKNPVTRLVFTKSKINYLVTRPTLSVELLVEGESCTWNNSQFNDLKILKQSFIAMII